MVTVETKDAYSNANGKTRAKRANPAPKVKNTGQGRQKVKQWFQKNDVLGKVGGILGVLGSQPNSQASDTTIVDTSTIDNAPEKKPMTTQTKVLIGVGVLAIIGVGYYLYKKNK